MKRLVVCIAVLVSTPAFAEQRLGEPCSLGYGGSGTWSQVPNAPPGALMCAQGFPAQPGPAFQSAPDWQLAPEVRVPEVPYQPEDRPLQSDQTDNAALRAAQQAAWDALNNDLKESERQAHSLPTNLSLSDALKNGVKSVNPPVGYVDQYKLPPPSALPSQNSPGVKLNWDTIHNQGQLSPDNCNKLGAC
jgi:hypothetical protein